MLLGPTADKFLGRVEAGFLRNGVLVTDVGYVAGPWTDGGVAPAAADDMAQRNAVIAAFDEAAAAADAAPADPAVDYGALAEQLRTQMD